jgi:tight adherence protein B
VTGAMPWVISLLCFLAAYLLVRYGYPRAAWLTYRLGQWYDKVLNTELLMNVAPRTALMMTGFGMVLLGAMMYAIGGNLIWGAVGAAGALALPIVVIRHLEQKRSARLEAQLVDGITTLASGVRAGLNIVQSMELLHKNSVGPLHQEVGQMLREYSMGLDLNHAMRRAADRIGSTNYRLLFTSLEMHRRRGGDAAESLDRIAESVREIQRLEGITSQGRMQANMMAVMPFVMLLILYSIVPEDVTRLFTNSIGRLLLLGAAGLIVAGFLWIRRIMAVDI